MCSKNSYETMKKFSGGTDTEGLLETRILKAQLKIERSEIKKRVEIEMSWTRAEERWRVTGRWMLMKMELPGTRKRGRARRKFMDVTREDAEVVWTSAEERC